MSSDNTNESFNLLSHEKKISELYHSNNARQGEKPSAQLDSKIIALAQKQLSENASLLSKDHNHIQQQSGIKDTKSKRINAWQWPFSLVASVGILSVLLITQKDYFIHPNDIAATDVGKLYQPVLKENNISTVESRTYEEADQLALPALQRMVSVKKDEVMLEQKFTTSARKGMSIKQSPIVLKEQTVAKTTIAANFAKKSFMSLSEMFNLAELLKVEQARQNKAGLAANAASIKMQQTLFEHLTEYQKSHKENKIAKEFLNVLTEKQIKHLQSMVTEAVPEN